MKNKSSGKPLIAVGIILIILALALVLFNVNRDVQSGKISDLTVNELEEQIPDRSDFADKKDNSRKGKKTISLNGDKYLGIIYIPSIGVKLPVLNDYTYESLAKAPCRYAGSVEDDDIVIAGHNYSNFFGGLSRLNSGDEVVLKLCDGSAYRYEVNQSQLIGGQNSWEMFDDSDGWDLTIFTCDWSGWSRVTVRCVRVDK